MEWNEMNGKPFAEFYALGEEYLAVKKSPDTFYVAMVTQTGLLLLLTTTSMAFLLLLCATQRLIRYW